MDKQYFGIYILDVPGCLFVVMILVSRITYWNEMHCLMDGIIHHYIQYVNMLCYLPTRKNLERILLKVIITDIDNEEHFYLF